MNATADDKKDDKKELPPLKPPYTERVTVKRWTNSDKKFLNPNENIEAYRDKSKDGKDRIYLKAGSMMGCVPGGPVEVKTEITDKDGKVFVVTNMVHVGKTYLCYVTEKPAEKKP